MTEDRVLFTSWEDQEKAMRSARIRREQERANLAENTKYQAGEKEAEESSEADANVSVGSSTSEEVEECELERKKLPESFASLEVKDKNFPAVRETPHKKDLSKDVVLPELKILNMPQTPKFRKDKLADSATSMTMESPMSLYAHNQDFSSPTIPKTNACLSPREKNDNDNGRPLFMSWRDQERAVLEEREKRHKLRQLQIQGML